MYILKQVLVHNPNQWPHTAQFIPSGTLSTVVIKPTYSYTTARMNR